MSKKRLISLFLAFAMAMSVFPLSVLADNGPTEQNVVSVVQNVPDNELTVSGTGFPNQPLIVRLVGPRPFPGTDPVEFGNPGLVLMAGVTPEGGGFELLMHLGALGLQRETQYRIFVNDSRLVNLRTFEFIWDPEQPREVLQAIRWNDAAPRPWAAGPAPGDFTLAAPVAEAAAVITLLPASVPVTTDGDTASLVVAWEFVGDTFNAAQGETNTFRWTVQLGELNNASNLALTGTIVVTNFMPPYDYNLASLTPPAGLTMATAAAVSAEVIAVLNVERPTLAITTDPAGAHTSLNITWSFDGVFNAAANADNTFRWEVSLPARVSNTDDIALFGTVIVTNFTPPPPPRAPGIAPADRTQDFLLYAPANVTIPVDLGYGALAATGIASVSEGGVDAVEGADWSFAASTLTLNASFLQTLATPAALLTVTFNDAAGTTEAVTVNIIEEIVTLVSVDTAALVDTTLTAGVANAGQVVAILQGMWPTVPVVTTDPVITTRPLNWAFDGDTFNATPGETNTFRWIIYLGVVLPGPVPAAELTGTIEVTNFTPAAEYVLTGVTPPADFTMTAAATAAADVIAALGTNRATLEITVAPAAGGAPQPRTLDITWTFVEADQNPAAAFDPAAGATNNFRWTVTLPGNVDNADPPIALTGTVVVTNYDPGVGEVLRGDVNDDGVVNAADVFMIRARFAPQWVWDENFPDIPDGLAHIPADAAVGDVNRDGVVNAADVFMLRARFAPQWVWDENFPDIPDRIAHIPATQNP